MIEPWSRPLAFDTAGALLPEMWARAGADERPTGDSW